MPDSVDSKSSKLNAKQPTPLIIWWVALWFFYREITIIIIICHGNVINNQHKATSHPNILYIFWEEYHFFIQICFKYNILYSHVSINSNDKSKTCFCCQTFHTKRWFFDDLLAWLVATWSEQVTASWYITDLWRNSN